MFKEFKEFAMRGNVVDMAVGIIIGAAFGTIVKSLVDDVIMPPIGLLLGNVDFSNLFLVLKAGKSGGALRKPCRRQGCRGGNHELRHFYEHDHQFSYCGFCGIPADQADERP